MKIAVVTDDQVTISQHFGRAHYYLVFTVEDGQVIQQELRDKLGHDQFQNEQHEHDHDHDHAHGHGYGQHSHDKHSRMMANLTDCQVLLAGGTLAPALRRKCRCGHGRQRQPAGQRRPADPDQRADYRRRAASLSGRRVGRSAQAAALDRPRLGTPKVGAGYRVSDLRSSSMFPAAAHRFRIKSKRRTSRSRCNARSMPRISRSTRWCTRCMG